MSFFDRFAERASKFVSKGAFFAFYVVLVLVWAPSLPLWGTVDTWQLVINTMTTIITFLLVALLQNSQWRGAKATNVKLDAIADGLADTMESLAALMASDGIDEHEREMLFQAGQLRKTVGVEKEISTSDHASNHTADHAASNPAATSNPA